MTKSVTKPARTVKASRRKPRPKPLAATETYWQAVRRPVYSLAFLLPMMLIYEAGVVLWGRRAAEHGELRNGADWLMRRMLESASHFMGWSGLFLSGAAVVATLFAWQVISRRTWSVRLDYLVGMLSESVMYAVVLPLFYVYGVSRLIPGALSSSERMGFNLTMSLGAGIYEEFVFRLVLVTLVALVISRAGGVDRHLSLFVGAVVSAFVFAAVHYVWLGSDPFHWASFSFRVVMGLFFGAVYVARGFGIAAGCHAFYDMLVYVLLIGR